MTGEEVVTNGTTTDATPVSLLERALPQGKMIRLDAIYNVFKVSDMTKIASGRISSVFQRVTSGDVTRTSATQDVAEVGDTLGSMAGTQPYIELVANTSTQEVQFIAHGNSDTLFWDIISNNIISS